MVKTIKNESGFSLISYLVGLSLFVFILPLISKSYIYMQPSNKNEIIAIEHFYNYLYDDLIEALEVEIKNEYLNIKVRDRDNKISMGRIYKTDANNVVRSVQGGHEVYVREIKTIHFKKINGGVLVNVKTLTGNEYEKAIIYK